MRTLAEVWPDPEKVPQLVALCRGATSGFFSISSKTLRCGNGISGRRSNTAGAAMSWFLQIKSRLHEREGKALTNLDCLVTP